MELDAAEPMALLPKPLWPAPRRKHITHSVAKETNRETDACDIARWTVHHCCLLGHRMQEHGFRGLCRHPWLTKRGCWRDFRKGSFGHLYLGDHKPALPTTTPPVPFIIPNSAGGRLRSGPPCSIIAAIKGLSWGLWTMKPIIIAQNKSDQITEKMVYRPNEAFAKIALCTQKLHQLHPKARFRK